MMPLDDEMSSVPDDFASFHSASAPKYIFSNYFRAERIAEAKNAIMDWILRRSVKD